MTELLPEVLRDARISILAMARNLWPETTTDEKIVAHTSILRRIDDELAGLPVSPLERLYNEARIRIVALAMALHNYGRHNPRCLAFGQHGYTGKACTCGLEKALAIASPRWKPTHRHYKGGLYRVIGPIRMSEDWDTPHIEYENQDGERIVRPTAVFNDILPDGRRRFEPIGGV